MFMFKVILILLIIMEREIINGVAARYQTTPDNIVYHQNPDQAIIYYKYAEYDQHGKMIGKYQPKISESGYLQLCERGPILDLIKI